MLEQANDFWFTGELQHPFGRGINFQIEVADVQRLRQRIVASGTALFRDLKTSWYRQDDLEHGQSAFLAQDPDGYLLRFCQSLGERKYRS